MHTTIKPNFLVIGAMKASTTLLYEFLRQHPQIWLPREKEPHYFTSPDYGVPGAAQKYLALFAACPLDKLFVGEASTGYTKAPHLGPTPKRIRETLGQPKLIYILRDPVTRTISNFQHSYVRGYYPRRYSIARALIEDPIILSASCYARQLAEYETEFGVDSVLVLIAEELHRNPSGVMRQVERFLGAVPFEAWNPIGTINSASDVQRSVILEKLAGQSAGFQYLARHTPQWVKSKIRSLAPRATQPEPVSPGDQMTIFNLVADDLIQLREKLGERISCWPSVQMLSPAVRNLLAKTGTSGRTVSTGIAGQF